MTKIPADFCLFLTSFLPKIGHFDFDDHNHLMKLVFFPFLNNPCIKVVEVGPIRSFGWDLIISLK